MKIERQYGSFKFSLEHETRYDDDANVEHHGDHFVGTVVNDAGHRITLDMNRRTNELVVFDNDPSACKTTVTSIPQAEYGTENADFASDSSGRTFKFDNIEVKTGLHRNIFDNTGWTDPDKIYLEKLGPNGQRERLVLDYGDLKTESVAVSDEFGTSYDLRTTVKALDKIVVTHEQASLDFNCHSYAWHSAMGDPTDPENKYSPNHWDNNPVDDMRQAVRLSRDEARVGDIVVYGHDKNGNGLLDSMEETLHSAVVVKVDANGKVERVQGKEGPDGFSNHAPDSPSQAYRPEKNALVEWYRPNETQAQRDERVKFVLSAELPKIDKLDSSAKPSNRSRPDFTDHPVDWIQSFL